MRRVLSRTLAAACAALLGPALLAGCGGAAQGALRPPSTVGPAGSATAGSATAGSAPTGGGSAAGRPVAPSSTPAAPASSVVPTPSPPGTPSGSSSGPAEPAPPTGPPGPGSASPSSPARATGTPAPPPGDGVSPAVVYSTAGGGRSVSLTFDDGPGPATGQILDVLAQYGVQATFCEIGPQAAADPATVRRVLAAGHRLCDHSVHHPLPFAPLPHDRQVYEISAARDMIVRAGGPGTRVAWFRAPGGGFTASNQQVAASYGMRPLGWTVDTRDWARPGVAAILAAVQRELRPGGVILLHDGGGDRSQTVAALRQLLPLLAAQGYRFGFPTV